MVVGEAALAVSLADSLFLSIDPGAARSKVMLFLAISLAPFAVLAPIIGPYIDRLPGGRRITVCLVGLMRAMVLIAMMKWLNSLVLFPLAFLSLVLAKTYGVSRSAIMPTVVDGTEQLMAANGKLGRLTSVVGFLGGAPAVLLQLIDTRLSLGLSACAFAGAGIAALALPRHVAAVPNAMQEIEKHELHGPEIRQAAFVMLVLRAAVGFMFFHLAFWLRDQKAGTAWFGLAVAVCSLSTFAANAIGPLLRRRILTATEAGIIQDNANARSSEKLALIELSIAECAKRLIKIAQQYMTGEQAVRIVGTEAEPLWLQFDRDYITGEFDFDVEGGSTAPVNESFKRQMAMQVVNAMAPFAGAGIINMPKLAAYVLENGFGIRSAASFVIQPNMPAQQTTPQGIPQPTEGMPPQGGPPQGGQQQLPPEILAALQQGGGMPPGMPPQAM